MSIYTRQGDNGETSLAEGSRVAKDSARVEAYGTLDEAGSSIGLARAAVTDAAVDRVLRFVQQRLMNCASITARPAGSEPPDHIAISPDDIAALERAIDDLCASSAWTGFVLGGGSEAASRLHVARAVTRRAERRLLTLSSLEPVDASVLAFVNRASDALYAAARCENHSSEATEEPWDPAAVPEF